MSESDEGVIVSDTRQNAGSDAAALVASAPPDGGVNEPAATTCEAVMVVFCSERDAASRVHAAAVTAPLWAWTGAAHRATERTAAAYRIVGGVYAPGDQKSTFS